MATTEKQGSLRPEAAKPHHKRKGTTRYPVAGQVGTSGRKRMWQAKDGNQGPS